MDLCTFQFKALNNNKITATHTAAPQSRNTINGLSAFRMSKKYFCSHRCSDKNGERKMKITKKQIEEWNEKCGNGFKVNE